MKKIIFFVFCFSFSFSFTHAQNSTSDKNTKITISFQQIYNSEELGLLDFYIFQNKNYITSYLPIQYIKDNYKFELVINKPKEDFLTFLFTPNPSFFLQNTASNPDYSYFIQNTTNYLDYNIEDNKPIEVTFWRSNADSNNYLTLLEESNFKDSLRFFFDSSVDYEYWQPNFLETENNNRFLFNNPVLLDIKILSTLNNREDKDIFSFDVISSEKLNLDIKVLSKQEDIYLNIYNQDFELLKNYSLTGNTPANYVAFEEVKAEQKIYLEFTSIKGNSRRKNFNISYVFWIYQ